MVNKYIQDAGHGGTDNGMSANGMVEKEWTLEAARYVNSRLEEEGVTSSLTRDSDRTLTGGPRTNIVQRSGADVCLSHHFNAAGGRGQGCEFIHSIYVEDPELERIMRDNFKEEGMNCRRIFDKENSRGTDYYYMHRNTGSVRTVIIEYGFADNWKDYTFLEENRFSLYEAVVKSVCEYEGVSYSGGSKGSKSGNITGSEKEVTVEEGDTLWGLAQRYDVSVGDLKKWNSLEGDTITIGQELIIAKGLDLNLVTYTFKNGSKGKNVAKLQEDLIALGYSLEKYGADGHYGSETEEAVKAFQSDNGLSVDGIYGPNTREAMGRYS